MRETVVTFDIQQKIMKKNMNTLTVACHVEGKSAAQFQASSTLEKHGLSLTFGDEIIGSEDLALFHIDTFQDVYALRQRYLRLFSPSLVLVHTDEQEMEVLDFLRISDEVCRADLGSELLFQKLIRVLCRSKQQGSSTQDRKDPLTGLLTRFALANDFKSDADEDLIISTDTHALLFLDLDNIKSINDKYGHDAGDEALREVSGVLLSEAGPKDKVYRLGGDEFVFLCSRYSPQTVLDTADKIRDRIAGHTLNKEFFPDDKKLTVSIGVSIFARGDDYETVVRQADVAMYNAKDQGRNRVVCYQNMQELAASENLDIQLQHFENVTRVVTERVATMITKMGSRLVEAARLEANQDALTKLHNRRYFDSRLSREFDLARKHGRTLAIAFMDVDHFHDVNITYGWPTGDHVLSSFGTIVLESIRVVDWVARYGGEEFCVVMPDTTLDQATEVAERIRIKVAEASIHSLDHRSVPVTVSIGVATLTRDVRDPIEFVQKASNALLNAKKSGRNRVCHSD